jgi:tetratricopeptide (TPR) repeat protein
MRESSKYFSRSRAATGRLLCALCLFGVGAVPALAQTTDESIDSAVGLYETRQLDLSRLQQSYEMLEQIVANNPGNLRAHFELSHVCFFAGDAAPTKHDKLKFYDRGYEVGKQAVEIDPSSADAHLWLMVDRGRQGQTKGVLNSLWMIPELKREINTVLKIDPSNALAMDVKAMIYYQVPGIAGGDLNVAEQTLNQALAIDSNYSLLYTDMAKVLEARHNYERAKWYLNRCLQVENPTFVADFVLTDKPLAEKMLGEIERR